MNVDLLQSCRGELFDRIEAQLSVSVARDGYGSTQSRQSFRFPLSYTRPTDRHVWHDTTGSRSFENRPEVVSHIANTVCNLHDSGGQLGKNVLDLMQRCYGP